MKKNNQKFINREISWLHFNERVLQEAADETTPLLERIRFLGIFSNNLDEFFRVRVATISRLIDLEQTPEEYGLFDPKKVLKKITEITFELQKKFENIYDNIVKELANQNIFIVNEEQLTEDQGVFVKNYFMEKVRPHIFPMMLNNFKEESALKDKSIYLVVRMRRFDGSVKENIAIVKIPATTVSRFLVLPQNQEKKYVILLDDVIRYCLEDVFCMFNYDTFDAFTIKLTRDAEIDIDNDVSKSFMEIISESLKQRKMGRPVRFIYDKEMPASILKELIKKLKITKKDNAVPGARYHNFKDFLSFPNLGSQNFIYPQAPPLIHKELSQAKSIISAIKQKDIMLHFPYQSFQYIINLLGEAAIDPKVKSIKMTLYRAARNSSVINALINAARNGKSVTVFVELLARFDEKANIYYSEKLQEEGVKIIHGIPGIKVHSKLILIKRKENNQLVNYANVGTGNFNEETARIYADDSLLTANPLITDEVDKVFTLFETNFKTTTFKNLVVSPFNMRNHFTKLINKEISNVKEGKDAWIIIKVNNLVDETIVRKLYLASQEGVKIKIIVRGICVLMPGIEGLSENIEAIGIIDRYLEHSRVFVFCNDGDEKFFISSADWMTRNFDYRIEVATPIFDKEIQMELKTMLNIQLEDNTKARIINYKKPNEYKKDNSEISIRSQAEIYSYLKQMAASIKTY